MTNQNIIKKLMGTSPIKEKIDQRLYNKAVIFCEFVTNKYANSVYEDFKNGKVDAVTAFYNISTISL